MPKQRRMTDENKPVSFRPSAMTRWQLDDLIEKMNENQTQVIVRAIERLWVMEVGTPGSVIADTKRGRKATATRTGQPGGGSEE